jgi:lipid-A-disaccharide synthase
MFDVFITTNGPGEIATWVTPVVKELKARRDDLRISLFIQPCRFATGTEEEIALSMPEIDYVFRGSDFKKRLFHVPFQHSKKGVVIFLGGDLLSAVLLKLRYGYKTIAYTEGDQSWKFAFDVFLTRDHDGDLMFAYFEHIEIDEKMVKDLRQNINIVFFPGSRPDQFKHLFPLFQRVVRFIPKEYRCLFNVSSFIPDAMIEEFRVEGQEPVKVFKGKSPELMKSAELAVTIPGTNNIQLAYLGIPALIVFPFNYPEVVQFRGLLGALMNLPFLKMTGKRWLLGYLDKKVEYTSLVNTKEKKQIFPELRGILSEQQIADAIIAQMKDYPHLRAVQKTLSELNKKSDALDLICYKVKEFL